MMKLDCNNNEEQCGINSGMYVERHLQIGTGTDFLIIPNGGSGDCMFKAVSQAVNGGNESQHREIRMHLVNYIITQRWDKFKESIEIQHIVGNNLLQRQWAKDPKEAYRAYMSMGGTLGSSSELTAAAELFSYNFATIQEYSGNDGNTYRVENCVTFDESVTNFHYFYFTGDFDNGHWENIKKLTRGQLDDGTYQGRHRILINDEEVSFEDWLRRETENTNDAEQLKFSTDQTIYIRRRTSHPFELKGLRFSLDGTVLLRGNSFTIAPVQYSDLFSVLAHECLKNEAAAHEIELILIKHRYSYFEDINYKLITQPWSHHFTVDAIRYSGQSLKGNIQDLIAAADLYSFSFVLFLKMSDEGDTHQCKFSHVDRWGGESDRILYFFMRLSRNKNCEQEQLIAKWWRLIPVHCTPTSSDAKLFCEPSRSRTEYNDVNDNPPRSAFKKRPSSQVGGSATGLPPRYPGNNADIMCLPPVEDQEYIDRRRPRFEPFQIEPSAGSLPEAPHAFDSEGGNETDECLRRDHDRMFGIYKPGSVVRPLTCEEERQMKQRIKPATGRDLIEHPEKIKTVVRLSDGSQRAVTYAGNGYLRTDDVISDLRNQGLIRIPSSQSPRNLARNEEMEQNEMELQRKLSPAYQGCFSRQDKHWRDDNYNEVNRIRKDDRSSSRVYQDDHPYSQEDSKYGTGVSDPPMSSRQLGKDNLKLTRGSKKRVSPPGNDSRTSVTGRHKRGSPSCLRLIYRAFKKITNSLSKITKSVKHSLRDKRAVSPKTTASKRRSCESISIASIRREKRFPLRDRDH